MPVLDHSFVKLTGTLFSRLRWNVYEDVQGLWEEEETAGTRERTECEGKKERNTRAHKA